MGKSFADVLFEAEEGRKLAEKTEAEFEKLQGLFSEDVVRFFQNPVFDHEEKEEVLAKIAAEAKLTEVSSRFLSIVIRQNLIKYLPDIARSFSENILAHRQELRANLTTAFKLSSEEQAEIARSLEKALGKKMVCDVQVDPELIGGVVARVGGVVFDASIRGYLDRMQEEIAS